MMTLKQFRVKNFRSIMDSGWIDCDNVTSLVGINEAGKSNIILALWKLNPAREGQIDLLHDMPAKEFSSWRNKPEQIEFITADFELDKPLTDKIVSLTGCDYSTALNVRIMRKYDGNYVVSFPNYSPKTSIEVSVIQNIILSAKNDINLLSEKTKGEEGIKDSILQSLDKILAYIANKKCLEKLDQNNIISFLPTGTKWAAASEIRPQFENIKKMIVSAFTCLNIESPSSNADVRNLMATEMPSFVYYSNYGNLDAQIYLPHAVKLLNGEKIPGFDNEAKVRTLRVLFDFVNLKPQEVLDLGKDPAMLIRDQYGRDQQREPTVAEIQEATKKKEERTILLQSASSKLTREFGNWWKQGNYIFRLQADGDFFKIWVSDEKRPEEIELERRSTGLQWFLSFFLIFLVESTEAHKGAILLLDEAGLTLHPMAQKDLVAFFENLSKSNQIIHTTHSPFLVDTTNIDRVKVVYSDNDGYTVASSNLRAADDKLNEKSIYAVHAALGLSVSDILLQGCQPVIVEGPSDQYYLNAIKLYLIKNQKFTPNMELVFVPTGGVKGVPGVVSIVSGKTGDLPLVILDADKSGKDAKNKLHSNLYTDAKERVLDVSEFVGFDNSEIEDLIPVELMLRHLDKIFRDVEDDNFADNYNNTMPIVPQIENYAKHHNIDLGKGWKVSLAKSVKQQLFNSKTIVTDDILKKWENLFIKFNI